MTSIIQPRSCSNCASKFRDPNNGQIVCRRFPPSVMPIMIPNSAAAIARGAPPVQIVGYSTQFPQVNAEMFCGEYRAGLTFNEHEMQAAPRVEGSDPSGRN